MSIDTDYVYAGKGWEPQINEICEAENCQDDGDWIEAVIKHIGNPLLLRPDLGETADYTIEVPGYKSNKPSGLYLISTNRLRKRRPPEQKDSKVAEKEFIKDLNNWLTKEKVEA